MWPLLPQNWMLANGTDCLLRQPRIHATDMKFVKTGETSHRILQPIGFQTYRTLLCRMTLGRDMHMFVIGCGQNIILWIGNGPLRTSINFNLCCSHTMCQGRFFLKLEECVVIIAGKIGIPHHDSECIGRQGWLSILRPLLIQLVDPFSKSCIP